MVYSNPLANVNEQAAWSHNWVWGVPLIVITVLIHVVGLDLMRRGIAQLSRDAIRSRYRHALSVTIIGAATLCATGLLGIEAAIWSYAYLFLKALPDHRAAMLYSLNAITSFGHTDVQLAYRWQLLGSLESLNGWLLFGLSTAFLFAVIAKLASSDRSADHGGESDSKSVSRGGRPKPS